MKDLTQGPIPRNLMGMAIPVAACLSISFACDAQIHRWTDSDGRVHYGDHPPDAQGAKTIVVPGGETSAPVDVEVLETTVEWFDIRGFSTREMRESMLQTAPYSLVQKSPVWGQCRWWFEWKFGHRVAATSCRIDKVAIKVHAQMKLPRWVDANHASSDLRQRWDDFERRLRQHEDGHKANGIRAANDLARRLRALPEFKDCVALNAEIVKTRSRVLSEYRLLDNAFDRVERIYLKGFQ